MALPGWTLTLTCNECGKMWTRNSREDPDDRKPYRRTGPCGHDSHTVKNVVDFDG